MALKIGTWFFVGLLAPSIAASQSPHDAGPGETITLNAQADSSEWEENEHFRKFYSLSVEMLGSETDEVDVELYEQRSFTIFRAAAISLDIDPDAMIDHLKNIPREMVTNIRRDPTILDSYESFNVALRGPK